MNPSHNCLAGIDHFFKLDHYWTYQLTVTCGVVLRRMVGNFVKALVK